jgi:hypothetical protein
VRLGGVMLAVVLCAYRKFYMRGFFSWWFLVGLKGTGFLSLRVSSYRRSTGGWFECKDMELCLVFWFEFFEVRRVSSNCVHYGSVFFIVVSCACCNFSVRSLFSGGF